MRPTWRTGSLVLDAGCGPGLVSQALLAAGFRVVGVDLSREMIERAGSVPGIWRERSLSPGSIYDRELDALGPFDATLSRYVLHHVEEPAQFVARQIELLRPGGVVIVNDHITDPDPTVAAHHAALEVARDRTHTRNLTGGELVDLFTTRAWLTFIIARNHLFSISTSGSTGARRRTARRPSAAGCFRARSSVVSVPIKGTMGRFASIVFERSFGA